jgi:uncharacterized MnhB-related membrane protein
MGVGELVKLALVLSLGAVFLYQLLGHPNAVATEVKAGGGVANTLFTTLEGR